MAERYANIVFMQGEEADEPLRILYDKHDDGIVWGWPDKTVEAIEYLAQWDNGEYSDIREKLCVSQADYQVREGDYVLSWSVSYGYIGLERIIREEVSHD